MLCNNFGRLGGAVKHGVKRLVSERGNGVLDKFEVLTGQGRFFLEKAKFVSSWTSTDFYTAERPSVIAAAQENLPIIDRRNRLSLIGAHSPATSVPSVSASFQVGGRHIDCLVEPEKVASEINPQSTSMAAFGSSCSLFDRSLSKLASRSNQHGASASTSLSFSSKRSFHSCRKPSMSLVNKKQPNNFVFCGYFIYNVAKISGNNNRFEGVGFENFYTSSSCSSAGTSPEVSSNNSLQENPHSSSTDSVDEKIPMDRILKLNSASCYLPHPDKEETGGEDAHFICTDKHAIGVADGVGGWADLGIDAGQYARELMANSVLAIQEEPTGSIDPARVLEKAYVNTRAKGSSTACIIALTDQGLHAINLGDSGFMVVRDGSTVFRSSAQLHDFNFPYQLECGRDGDLPSAGEVSKIPVAPGDVIIAGTDGLFDNLYNNDITSVAVHAVRAGFGPQVTAQKIAALARQRAQDKNRQTPFSTAAQEAGFRYRGGKLDDVTVIVSYITSDHNETSSTDQ